MVILKNISSKERSHLKKQNGYLQEEEITKVTLIISEKLTIWNITRDKIKSNRGHGKQATEIWDIMAYFAHDKIYIEEIFPD
ncbi:hypothetical protein WBP_0827 [Wolbachia endosymbiont of Brugia pahangi]|nr:hypothetical protein WBP_0827 [Wolbachia endosymbiont of Brugia pahangi]